MKHSTKDLHVSMQTIFGSILFLVQKFKNTNYIEIYRHKSLADQGDTREAPPLNIIYIIFMQFWAKVMQNYKIGAPPFGKSWIRHCKQKLGVRKFSLEDHSVIIPCPGTLHAVTEYLTFSYTNR